MDVPKLPIFHKIGYVSFILTGIPLPIKGKCVLVWVKLAIGYLCLLSKLLLSLVALYYLLKDEIFSGENIKENHDYFSIVWIIYFWIVLLVHLILFYNRGELECVFDVLQSVEEMVVRKRNIKDIAVLLWKVFIVCVTVPGVIISVNENNRCFLKIIHLDGSSRTVYTLTLFYFSPVFLFAWVVFYNITAVWTTILAFNREIVKQACDEKCFDDLQLRDRSVEGQGFSIYVLEGSRREHWSGRLLRLFTTLKMFRRYTNRKLSASLSLFMVAHSFFVPIVFYSYYQHTKNEILHSSFYRSEILYNIFWILLFLLLPVFLKEWTKNVSRDSVLMAKKDIYMVYNLQTKKRLRKFVASASDDYPESYFKFFNLDSAMLSSIFDVTILLATTFVLPSG